MLETQKKPRPVRFRKERFEAKLTEAGCADTSRDRARFLGVTPTIVWKLTERDQMPSFLLLARLRRIWPEHDTDYWLEYCEPPATQARAKSRPARATAKAA